MKSVLCSVIALLALSISGLTVSANAMSMLIPNAFESQVIEVRAGDEITLTLPRIPTAYVVWVDAEDIRRQGLLEEVKTSHRVDALELILNIKLSSKITSGQSFKITIYQLDPVAPTIKTLMTNELIIKIRDGHTYGTCRVKCS